MITAFILKQLKLSIKGNYKYKKRKIYEYDFGYDQSCCPKCGYVMINNLHWEVHCDVC